MARIHSMARMGRYQEVGDCLAAGADPNAVSVKGWTPLLLAAREGHVEILRLLLKAGADPRMPLPNGRTALHLAVGKENSEVIRTLLAAGADIDAVDRKGDTPLIEAAHFCRHAAIAVLREAGADLTVRDKKGKTVEEWLDEGGIPGYFKKQFPDMYPEPDEPGQPPSADERTVAEVRKQMAEGLSPEEYAAKHGRYILIWSYGYYRYRDPEMEAWVHEFEAILFSSKRLAEAEERHLKGEDLEHARKKQKARERRQKRTRKSD
jgi:hypothetical protein